MIERYFTPLEDAVVAMMLSGGDPLHRALQAQLHHCYVTRRELTGVGFFTYLSVDCKRCCPATSEPRLWLGNNVASDIEGLRHGAGFALLITNGYLHMLEGYSFDEPWPNVIERFSVRFVGETS